MLGTELLCQLAGCGHDIVASYRSEAKLEFARRQFELRDENSGVLFDKITWKSCDLLDITGLEDLLTDIDQVYHCAALVSFDSADDDALINNNVRVAANVLDMAREKEVEKLVHVSSVAALGRNASGKVIDEKSRWTGRKGNSAYARSKYLSELEAWRAYEEGLPMAIVNPSIIIGPGDWQTGSSALYGKIANGFRFYSEGVNAYVDVRDVATAMIRLMDSDILGERFVLMSENRSYREVFDMIAKSLEVKSPSIKARPWMGALVWRLEKLRSLFIGSRPMVTPDTVKTSFQANHYSNDKARKMLDMEFRPVEESIGHFAELYKRDQES